MIKPMKKYWYVACTTVKGLHFKYSVPAEVKSYDEMRKHLGDVLTLHGIKSEEITAQWFGTERR